MFYVKNLLSVLLLLVSFSAFSNDSASVTFVFGDSLSTGRFYVAVHDGINEHKIDLEKEKSWRGELFSPLGHITIGYQNSDTTNIMKEVFFHAGSSKLVLKAAQNVKDYYIIDENSSVNLISYKEAGGAVLDSFVKEESDAMMDFILKNRSRLGTDTAIVRKAFNLGDKYSLKRFEFITRFPDLYASFWIFYSQQVRTSLVSPDSLMKVYNTQYADRYKGNKAAKHLEALISNKIAVHSNKKFPDFSVTDLENNKFESSKLRGKYVLIQFWASWCAPCLMEMPDLKKLNEKYKGPEFVLISISIDKDSAAFRRALQLYSMDWPQVYGDNRLYDSLAYIPIPQVYLVDKTGRTIYNSTVTIDKDLSVLKKLLAEHMKQKGF